jgi:nucleotide-binding universal stress UspA family protein
VVDNPIASGALSAEVYVPDLPQILDSLMHEAEKRLTVLKAVAAGDGVPTATHVLTGQPAHTIVEHARTGGFDLIVMGTHGRTGFSHLFVGSVAERVVRRAPCPVLTVRDMTIPADEAGLPAAKAAA